MQPTLCARCHKNMAVVFINRIENGQIVPRLDQLEAIAAATHTRITALFDSPYK